MKLQFTFKHLDRSEALEEYSLHKVGEISRFLLKEGLGQVCFSKTRGRFTATLTFSSKEKYFKAQAHNADIYSAIDLAIEKLERQFLKTRKLHQNHKKFELSKEGRMRLINGQLEYVGRLRKAA